MMFGRHVSSGNVIPESCVARVLSEGRALSALGRELRFRSWRQVVHVRSDAQPGSAIG